MAIQITQTGTRELLARMVGISTTFALPLKLKLFTNRLLDLRPTYMEGTQLREPLSTTGYASIDITDWVIATESGRYVARPAVDKRFNFTSGDFDITGYFLEANGIIIWSEAFTDVLEDDFESNIQFHIPTGGGAIIVRPSISLPI